MELMFKAEQYLYYITIPKMKINDQNFRFVTICALSAFMLMATMSNASPINTLNAFAQSSSNNTSVGNTTASDNVTGGGVNVPLNESSSSPKATIGNQSIVPASNENQNPQKHFLNPPQLPII